MKKKQRLIMIGLGMATVRLLDGLVAQQAQDRYDIMVFGEERTGGYNRILLSHVLSGEQALSDIVTHDEAWFRGQNIRLIHSAVVRIDRLNHCVQSADGVWHNYDKLVIATGSLPIKPEMTGSQLTGVLSFRDVLDVQQLLALKAKQAPVVVVGAGLLGLEAAYGLVKQGLPVTVVHRSDRIMSQQLDHAAGALLQAQLESLGIRFVLSAQLDEIIGDDAVSAVKLTNGGRLTVQAVVMAMGITPNAVLARTSGILVNRGIVVNAQCQTDCANIYAIGESSEFEGKTFGLVAPIYRQVSVLINHLCGDDSLAFEHQETATQLKVSGIQLASFGAPLGQKESQVLLFEDMQSGVYRKLLLDADNRITAGVFLGNTQGSQRIFQRYQQGEPLSLTERSAYLFGQIRDVSEGV